MDPIFPGAPPTLVPIVGSDKGFPVRRVYCVGRNYAEHAREMGASGREAPFFFAKPADALLTVAAGQTGQMPYPSRTNDLHHEIELVVALHSGGRDLGPDAAKQCVWGYAVGLDMTRRDLQAQAKSQGRPWDTGKGFDGAAPIGPLHARSSIGELMRGAIRLEVNGSVRQAGDLADMIWSVDEIIAELSTYFELKAGDLVFTGTPAGVAAVGRTDLLVASVAGLTPLQVRIV